MATAADLQETLNSVPRLGGEWSFALLSHQDADGLGLTALGDREFENWLVQSTHGEKSSDDKLQAAYLCGQIGWSLAELFAGLALQNKFVSSIDPTHIRLRPRWVKYDVEGVEHKAQVFDIGIRDEAVCFSAERQDFGQAMETLFGPVVEQIALRTSLGKSALWRIMGDSLAAALLQYGRHFNREPFAIEFGREILRTRGTKLFSKQTDFIHIQLPEKPAISQWFRARGGCCRYYTTDGGEYCSTCVLRPPRDREEKLINYLRETHAA